MHMKELHLGLRNTLAPTTVACLVQEAPIIFQQQGAWVTGACDSIHWEQLNAVSDSLVRLAAQVLDRKENEFKMCPGYLVEGDAYRIRYGIHIELPGSDSASRPTFVQALGPFLRGIMNTADSRSAELFPAVEVEEHLEKKISAEAAETLRKVGGKRVMAPLALFAEGLCLRLEGQFAEAPPPEIDMTPFEVIGRIEGIERPERKFTVLIPGVRERLQRINFDLDRYLETFKNILCDDQVYRFTIHIELDAKSKPLAVVDNVARLDGAPFTLTS